MTEVKDNSSLPLLLSITGAVVVVAIGGWFFLNQEPVDATPTDVVAEAPAAEQAEVTELESEPA